MTGRDQDTNRIATMDASIQPEFLSQRALLRPLSRATLRMVRMPAPPVYCRAVLLLAICTGSFLMMTSGVIAQDLISEARSQRLEVELSGRVERRCVGGAGQFLVFTIPVLKQVVVFDATIGEIAKYIPADDPDIHIACSADQLFIVEGKSGIVTSYSLETFKKQLAKSIDVSVPIGAICIGASSQKAPLVVVRAKRTNSPLEACLELYSPEHLTRMECEYPSASFRMVEFDARSTLSCSADGRSLLIASRDTSLLSIELPKIEVIATDFDRSDSVHKGRKENFARICSRGQYVYSPVGIYSRKLLPISLTNERNYPSIFRIPDINGNFCLQVDAGDQAFGTAAKPLVHLNFAGTETSLQQLKNINPYEGGRPRVHNSHPPGFEESFFLFSSANLLVQVPLDGNRVLLHELDVDATLQRNGGNYLYVESMAPISAQPGSIYKYHVQAKSSRDQLSYQLLAAPPNMSIDQNGVVTWPVPVGFREPSVSVIVQVTADESQQTFDAFRIGVEITDAGSGGPMITEATKVEEEFEVDTLGPRPAAGFGFQKLPEIVPLKLEESERIISLPEPFDDLKIGGGGRYLILQFDRLKKLGVFDICQGKMTGYLPIPEGDFGYAAGANRLVVASGTYGSIKRYNLSTLQPEVTHYFTKGPIQNMFMGSATGGPVYIHQKTLYEYDLDSFDALKCKISGKTHKGTDADSHVRISSNGRLITSWGKTGSPTGLQSFVVEDSTLHGHYEHVSVGSALPSADGRVIYTMGGPYSDTLERRPEPGLRPSPAPSGNLYLTANSASPLDGAGNLTLRLQTTGQPLVQLPYDVQLGSHGASSRTSSHVTLEKRAIFCPNSGVIVIVPLAQNQLVLKPFNVLDSLKQSGVDFLFVTSSNKLSVKLGERVQHRVSVMSNAGAATFRLDSGGEGISITKDGILSWQVPDKYQGSAQEVIIVVKDKSGQEVRQNLTITVLGEKERRAALHAQATEDYKREMDERRVRQQARESEKAAGDGMSIREGIDEAKERAESDKASESESATEQTKSADKNNETVIAYPVRTWTDKNGQSLKAAFVQGFAGSVILKLPEGTSIALRLEDLSAKDYQYALQLVKKASSDK